jgi:c-di-GMP-binding flagellar brake protein YcgR
MGDANRRAAPRMQTGGLEAIYLFDNRVKNAQVLDLSVGGAMLRSESAPPVGMITDVTFSNGRHQVIRASARVVARDRKNQCIRLCFVGMRSANQQRLRRLIEQLAQSH